MSKCKKENARFRKESDKEMINLVDNLNQDDDMRFNRRAFLKTAVGASVALGVSTVPFGVRAMMGLEDEDYERVEITKLSDLPKGESMTFKYPDDDDAILVHTVNGDLVAYNSACTHLSCPVFYQKEDDVLLCPCHSGYFDVKNGHPIEGPPQRELPLIEIKVENDTVYAVGRKYRHG
ncbi:ubiquinol-cytochrome c reductase iron-sulfur subunit [Texcoconibacillus texcoconensis]|uniref:Nitrite reductase/ring-hydroxylating ferredoxin subunit n=1 Tax=Texcoconibacillus texcoconensis TaxID=1095777 RepID=A0A840QTE9_9BACI|nr:Rieske 2Fe-2S domain-containing protein [Texcoconibacillus texcoconensis]MBB5174816.1 nitrite reductase/ring-hydroxylating ferredoxin subunit [Texcoconibacillus texcoconensis]